MSRRTYIRSIREVAKGQLRFNGTVKPLEAKDRSNGLLKEHDICLVENNEAFLLTSERFGKKEVLEIQDPLE